MHSQISLIQSIDALLPQTQCGLCGHRDGCLPYAQAIAEGEAANLCVPGGQPVADALAILLNRTPLAAPTSVWPVAEDGRPQRIKAFIREDECIGCTKCISACPVDAIVGAAKLMHSVINDLCTGCELCLAPCPVDCIDLIPDSAPTPNAVQQLAQQHDLRQRYYAHIQREQQRQLNRKIPVVRAEINTALFAQFSAQNADVPNIQMMEKSQQKSLVDDAQSTIQLAKLRTQIKKLEKQLSVREHAEKRLQLQQLTQQLLLLEGL